MTRKIIYILKYIYGWKIMVLLVYLFSIFLLVYCLKVQRNIFERMPACMFLVLFNSFKHFFLATCDIVLRTKVYLIAEWHLLCSSYSSKTQWFACLLLTFCILMDGWKVYTVPGSLHSLRKWISWNWSIHVMRSCALLKVWNSKIFLFFLLLLRNILHCSSSHLKYSGDEAA